MTATAATTDRSRWIALYVLCTGMLMIVLDMTIVNVALPSIQEDLGFSQSSLAWVVNAYLISYGGLLLLAGRIGDLIGPRRVFLVGLAIFTTASALCAVAQGETVLVGARFIQGVGGALTSAVILGMIVRMFSTPRDLAKAMGVFGFVASAGGTLGLLAGGVLTQAINWHWIFFINLPVGVATALLARRYVEDAPGLGLRAGADLIGALLLTASLMLGVYTILGVSDNGWGSAHTLGLSAVSLTLGAAFIARQARIAQPLVPLRIFRAPNIAAANAVQALLVAGMFGMFFMGALYMQKILGYDALQVGLAFLPATLVMGTLSLRVSERVTMRYGPMRALIPSLAGILCGLLLLARTPVDGNYLTDLMPPMILVGFAGLGFPALATFAMSGAKPEDTGLASGLVNTSVQVGGAIGLAVLATLSSQRTGNLIAAGASHASALNSGYHLAYLIGAGLVVVAIALALTGLRVLPMPQHGEMPEPAAPNPRARGSWRAPRRRPCWHHCRMAESNIELVRRGLDSYLRGDVDAVSDLLDPAVRWDGLEGQGSCEGREQALEALRAAASRAEGLQLADAVPFGADKVMVALVRNPPPAEGSDLPPRVYNVVTLSGERVVRMQGFSGRREAVAAARGGEDVAPAKTPRRKKSAWRRLRMGAGRALGR